MDVFNHLQCMAAREEGILSRCPCLGKREHKPMSPHLCFCPAHIYVLPCLLLTQQEFLGVCSPITGDRATPGTKVAPERRREMAAGPSQQRRP